MEARQRHSTCARNNISNKHELNNIKVSKLAAENTLYDTVCM